MTPNSSCQVTAPPRRGRIIQKIYLLWQKNNSAGALELCIYDGFSSHTTYVPDAVWEFAALALSTNTPRPLLEEGLSHSMLSSAE